MYIILDKFLAKKLKICFRIQELKFEHNLGLLFYL